MVDTTIRVKDKTYKSIIKTRGAFEQTFGVKLTLDEAMFLATSYINIAYEEFQTLVRERLIQIATQEDGSPDIKWSSLDQIAQTVLPRILIAFENFQRMLKQKSKSSLQYTVAGP